MKALSTPLFAALLLAGAALPAGAASLPDEQYVFDLGAGVMLQPRYPGSDEMIAVPFPIIAVSKFFLPGVGDVIDADKPLRRFTVYPSFDFNGKRDASDSEDLKPS